MLRDGSDPLQFSRPLRRCLLDSCSWGEVVFRSAPILTPFATILLDVFDGLLCVPIRSNSHALCDSMAGRVGIAAVMRSDPLQFSRPLRRLPVSGANRDWQRFRSAPILTPFATPERLGELHELLGFRSAPTSHALCDAALPFRLYSGSDPLQVLQFSPLCDPANAEEWGVAGLFQPAPVLALCDCPCRALCDEGTV